MDRNRDVLRDVVGLKVKAPLEREDLVGAADHHRRNPLQDACLVDRAQVCVVGVVLHPVRITVVLKTRVLSKISNLANQQIPIAPREQCRRLKRVPNRCTRCAIGKHGLVVKTEHLLCYRRSQKVETFLLGVDRLDGRQILAIDDYLQVIANVLGQVAFRRRLLLNRPHHRAHAAVGQEDHIRTGDLYAVSGNASNAPHSVA